MLHKKGQIGETLNWFVATLIILIILTISIYSASLLGKLNRTIDFGDKDIKNLSRKTMQAYLLTKNPNTQEMFIHTIEKRNNFDEDSKYFGKQLFNSNSPLTFLRLRNGNSVVDTIDLNPGGVSLLEKIKINNDLNLEVVTKNNENKNTPTL